MVKPDHPAEPLGLDLDGSHAVTTGAMRMLAQAYYELGLRSLSVYD